MQGFQKGPVPESKTKAFSTKAKDIIR